MWLARDLAAACQYGFPEPTLQEKTLGDRSQDRGLRLKPMNLRVRMAKNVVMLHDGHFRDSPSRPMRETQYLAGTLADHNARRHGVAGRYAWHDRSIGDAKVFDSIDTKFGIDD